MREKGEGGGPPSDAEVFGRAEFIKSDTIVVGTNWGGRREGGR